MHRKPPPLLLLLTFFGADALHISHVRWPRHAVRSTVRSEMDAESLLSLLSQPPIIINRMEVLDPDKGVLNPPTGVTLTPSGYLGLGLVVLQQLFAPWGYVKYSKRLRETEQAFLDAGRSPEQAIINAYNNAPPPPKQPKAKPDAEDEAATDEEAGGETLGQSQG